MNYLWSLYYAINQSICRSISGIHFKSFIFVMRGKYLKQNANGIVLIRLFYFFNIILQQKLIEKFLSDEYLYHKIQPEDSIKIYKTYFNHFFKNFILIFFLIIMNNYFTQENNIYCKQFVFFQDIFFFFNLTEESNFC